MEILNQCLKKKSFEQRNFFDFYDKILSPISYLKYTNDERLFFEETYDLVYLWAPKLKLTELIFIKISKNPLIEYKIEEIKNFIDKTGTVYEGLKTFLGKYLSQKD